MNLLSLGSPRGPLMLPRKGASIRPMLVIHGARITRSTDGGATFGSPTNTGATISNGGAATDGAGKVVVAGASSVAYSSDYGATWNTATPSQWSTWDSVFGVGYLEGVGFLAVGFDTAGNVHRRSHSTDGGATWSTQATIGGSTGYIGALNRNAIMKTAAGDLSFMMYANGNNSVSYLITNSGGSPSFGSSLTLWSGTPNTPRAFATPTVGGTRYHCSINNSREPKYINASTWSGSGSTGSPNPVDAAIVPYSSFGSVGVNHTTGVVVMGASSDSALFRSTNGGQNWSVISTGLYSASAIFSVIGYANGVWWALTTNRQLAKSIDDGATWTDTGLTPDSSGTPSHILEV